MKPAGLYIHIPFCLSKCGYCSFNSVPSAGHDLDKYLKAVIRQAEDMAGHPWTRKRTFTTLFIGGGTPTVYAAEPLAKLISACLRLFLFTEQPEVTVETNPNTVTMEKLQALKDAGANRLSIGIQSFSDPLLRAIDRSHTVMDAFNAVENAGKSGFNNINLDLIYGLPSQNLQDWEETVATALILAPEHLAAYELMIEPGTPFANRKDKGTLPLPDEETVIAMENTLQGQLQENGYTRYEISNFAKPDRQCLHNLNYWENGDYLGLGAGAVSNFSGLRVKNVAEPAAFVRLVTEGKHPFYEAEALSLEAAFRETVIMGLRMLAGVSVNTLEKRFGLTPESYYGKTLETLRQEDLIAIADGRLRLTKKALPVANQVLAQLV